MPGCSGCPLRQKYPDNPFVPVKEGTGLHLVIAEAPGELESVELEPLVGGSGRRFDALCRAASLHRPELTLTNTIQCRPPQNVYPTDSAARSYCSEGEAAAATDQCYSNYLKPLLHSRPWERLTLLGDKALHRLTGRSGIGANRGSVLPIPDCDNRLIGIATYHPSYVARDQTQTKVVISDLSKTLLIGPEYYNTRPSIEDVREFTATEFAFDIENDPKPPHTVRMVGLSAERFRAICVPFGGAYISELRRIFGAAKVVIGQNSLQHDEPILALNGVHISPDATHYDIMLMQHLLMPDQPHDLEFIASLFVAKQNWKHLHRDDEPTYNCRDTDVTYQIWLQLLPMLRKEGLLDLYTNIQIPLARICHLMSEAGVKVDPNRLKDVRERLQAELRGLESELPVELRSKEVPVNKRAKAPPGTVSEKTGKPLKFIKVVAFETEVPWRSVEVLKDYLYGKLGLPIQLHVKTKEPTVDKGALDKLYRKTKNPTLATLRRLKKAGTLLSSFASEALTRVEFRNTNFNVHGTASGRLSSSEPNLQNQPESARYLYVPRYKDWEFLEADYSGIENQLTALFAGDDERLAKFISNPTYSEHKHAVEVFFGIPYDDVEKDNDKDAPYGKAKRIVHGANYGLGARKLALMYDMDERECRDLIAKWKAAIPKTTLWQEETAKVAEQTGVLSTVFGRKRWFYTDSVYTESLSFLPQSSAADVIFRAMVSLYFERIGVGRERARLAVPLLYPLPKPALLTLQVHDSLLFEYPRVMREQVAVAVHKAMTQPFPQLGGFSLPIAMKVGGDSWGELEPYVIPPELLA